MFQTLKKPNSISLIPIHTDQFESWLETQDKKVQNWIAYTGFLAQESEFCSIHDEEGCVEKIFFGVGANDHLRWALGDISGALPVGNYHIEGDVEDSEIEALAVGWGLGQYSFELSAQKDPSPYAYLYVKNAQAVLAIVDAIVLIRDLINTPPNYMMPKDLSQATEKLAKQFNAEFSEISDQDELSRLYPAVYAVGKASEHKPRMIKLEWGDTSLPHICLVGKGVCFDTGGLDIKPSKFMRNMKKDMGGGAHVLGLASLLMALEAQIHLTVLIPAADNAISGNAFRPGDVINTTSGKTVEIDNTDAEGRLVLCDALTEASSLRPDLIIDFATLTGAARVALGTEIPVFFTNSDSLANELDLASSLSGELIWQLPLYKPYLPQLKSSVADLTNCSPEGYGGAITAALYLNEFVAEDIPWAHFDVMAWNTRSRPGRPVGGDAMGLLAVAQYLYNRYG